MATIFNLRHKIQKHARALNIAFATAVNDHDLVANNQTRILNAYRFRKINDLITQITVQAWFANLFKGKCQDYPNFSSGIAADVPKFIPI